MKYSFPFSLNKSETIKNYSNNLLNPLNQTKINMNQDIIKSKNDDILYPTEVEAYLNVNHQEIII